MTKSHQLTSVLGFAFRKIGPTATTSGLVYPASNASAQPGSGKQWSSANATTAARAASTPAAHAWPWDCLLGVDHLDSPEATTGGLVGEKIGPGHRRHDQLEPIRDGLVAEVPHGRGNGREVGRGRQHDADRGEVFGSAHATVASSGAETDGDTGATARSSAAERTAACSTAAACRPSWIEAGIGPPRASASRMRCHSWT